MLQDLPQIDSIPEAMLQTPVHQRSDPPSGHLCKLIGNFPDCRSVRQEVLFIEKRDDGRVNAYAFQSTLRVGQKPCNGLRSDRVAP